MSDTSEDDGTSPNGNDKELANSAQSSKQILSEVSMTADKQSENTDPDTIDDAINENGVDETPELDESVISQMPKQTIEKRPSPKTKDKPNKDESESDSEIEECSMSLMRTKDTAEKSEDTEDDPLDNIDAAAETSNASTNNNDNETIEATIKRPTIKLVPLSNLMAPSNTTEIAHIKSKIEPNVFIIDSSDSDTSIKMASNKGKSKGKSDRTSARSKASKSIIEISDSSDDSDICIQELIVNKKKAAESTSMEHTHTKKPDRGESPLPLITKIVKVKLNPLPKNLNALLEKHKLSEIRNEKQEIIAHRQRSTSVTSVTSTHSIAHGPDTDTDTLLIELKNSSVAPKSSDDEHDKTTRIRTRRKRSESSDDNDNRKINLRLSRRLIVNKSKSRENVRRTRWRTIIDDDSESGDSAKMRKKIKPRTVKSASDSDVDERDIASTSKARFTDNESGASSQDSSDNEDVKNGASDSDFVANEAKADGGSDSDFIQPSKKRRVMSRRRDKAASSDDNDSQDDDYDDNKKKKKKRKRIKAQKSDDSSDEYDEDGVKKKGRKNIRKVIKSRDLDDETKEAARTEQERKKRIEERQKMYNQIYDEKPEEVKELTSLVLDFDEETKEELLSVDRKLVKKLKPHQAKGVKFMWDACFESLAKMEENTGSGCILAHCMGLGKTLQVVTLIHTLLTNSDETNVEKVLVICPVSTVLNWVNEFKIWLRHCEANRDIEIYEISRFKQNSERAYQIKEWHQDGGVMIMGYDMFRNLSSDNKRIKKKQRETFQAGLVEPGPDLVICDEGHLLKNSKTSLSKAVNRIRTLRRIVLTGTPLQNNLNEYYCMVQFVKPNLLGKYNEYLNRFVNPITNGQYTDSTPHDITMMKRRSHILHNLLDGCVQRKDYSVLAPFLPPKQEYVVYINLTKIQCDLYKFYMQNRPNRLESQPTRSSVLFADFQNLQRIWTHPRVLRYNSDRYEINARKKRDMLSDDEEGSLKDFIDDDDDESDMSSSGSEKTFHSSDSDKKDAKQPRRTRATTTLSEPETEEVVKEENPTEWWMPLCPEEELDNLEHSGKLMLLFSILAECEAIGDKLLVFSQSLYSLDVIEHFLSLMDNNTQNPDPDAKLGGCTGSWTQGLDYFRLDGSTNIENRNNACKHFNQESNTKARLFLISTRAGGLGINLVAANRVVIFDVSWNPSHDIQSIFRVYRFGQKKPCYIYRFVSLGTMEEKIYERQVTKLAISKRVIDEHQIDRHYKETDLMELYKVDIEPEEPRALVMVPKDRLFADQLIKFEDRIYKYHEHDSLLENKSEETLSQEEIKAAWEEFEAEKTKPQIQYNTTFNYTQAPRAPGSGPVTSNQIFGFRTDVLLQLLNLRARKEYPQASQQSIAQIVPLLLKHLYETMGNGNPSFYQELVALQSALETPFGGQGNFNHSGPGTSSNSVVYSTQPPYHNNLIQQAQNRLMNIGNTENNANQVIEID